jgi:hypothetical protein
LPRFPAHASDTNERCRPIGVRTIHLFRRKLQYRLKQSDLRLANSELRRMHSDCEPAGSRCDVISRERSLTPLVKLAIRCESERVGWNRNSALDRF